MFAASVALAAFAVALAWPVPILLARASWPARAPGAALALWQAIALAGGLAMIGSLVTYGLIPFGDTIVEGFGGLASYVWRGTLPANATIWNIFALCFAGLLTVHLLLNLALTAIRTEVQRRRHLSLVQLLSSPMPDRPGTRLLEHSAPVAYCLPGATRSVTVLSDGLLGLLDADQVRAVIEHERTHLEQQHHLVVLAFKSWHSALPWFPIANRAENAVGLLTEMLADDRARRFVDSSTLATAIALVGSSSDGDDEKSGSSGSDTAELIGPRITRLLNPRPPLPLRSRILVIALAIGLVVIPPVLLLVS